MADRSQALGWLETEHTHLLAAQAVAAEHAWPATVWRLAWALDTFFHQRGHHRDQVDVWRAGSAAALQLGDATVRAVADRSLGYSLTQLGQVEEGITQLRQALALAESHHDTFQQARILRVLAMVETERGHNRDALRHATLARDLFHALDQSLAEADALNAMGASAARLGEYDDALIHCQRSLVLHRTHRHPGGEASALGNLGYIAHHAGDHHQAVQYYQQALALYRASSNTPCTAATLRELGIPHLALGDHEQARAVWSEALQLCQQMGEDNNVTMLRQQLEALNQPSTPPAPRDNPM
jgi:tetratricopeptide (TPR) repeat protein